MIHGSVQRSRGNSGKLSRDRLQSSKEKTCEKVLKMLFVERSFPKVV